MMPSDLAAYAPVTIFTSETRSDRLVGYATPKAGLRPSAVQLMAGDEIISAARATRYSQAAASAGMRYGWCGFELAGLPRALAISSECTVICAATGAVLQRLLLSPDVFGARAMSQQALTTAEVFEFAASERCQDILWVLPFAIDHRNRRGAQSFLEATWQMALDGLPDNDEREFWDEIVQTDDGIVNFLTGFVAATVGAEGLFRRFPGPFHPSFRYDRTLLS